MRYARCNLWLQGRGLHVQIDMAEYVKLNRIS